MNTKAILGTIAVIILLPVIYLLSGFYTPDPTYAFRGFTILPLDPSQGELKVPTVEEDLQGATMHAVFKPAFVQKIAGVQSPNPAGLDLVVDSIAAEIVACTEKGKIPPKADFQVATSCAEKDFASWQPEKKTSLLVDTDQKLIVLGASGNNMAKVYYNGMVASYVSPDMLQSDRKREACIVRVMLDFLIHNKSDLEASCAAAP